MNKKRKRTPHSNDGLWLKDDKSNLYFKNDGYVYYACVFPSMHNSIRKTWFTTNRQRTSFFEESFRNIALVFWAGARKKNRVPSRKKQAGWKKKVVFGLQHNDVESQDK